MMMQSTDDASKAKQPPQTPHRYDGVAKVTGTAKYAAEFSEPFRKSDLVYAYMVQSTIANGTVAAMDTKLAERGVGSGGGDHSVQRAEAAGGQAAAAS